MTTRLRDEAVLAVQEVRERSAGVRKDLAAARDELEDIHQKITARSAELATITKRLDMAGLRESQAKQKAETSPVCRA
jgi:predicted  nucleic acid-binding Zn-ribbon protein